MAGPRRTRRNTLDGQLVDYWSREADRLDALAAGASFGWQARRYARKAVEARARGQRFAAREANRDAERGPVKI